MITVFFPYFSSNHYTTKRLCIFFQKNECCQKKKNPISNQAPTIYLFNSAPQSQKIKQSSNTTEIMLANLYHLIIQLGYKSNVFQYFKI